VPKPDVRVHTIAIDRRPAAACCSAVAAGPAGQVELLPRGAVRVQRHPGAKVSQLAKGFRYVTKAASGRRRAGRVLKPAFVADLIDPRGRLNGLQVLVWTVFDAEAEILGRLL
jgi:hypothetical protein